MMKRAGRIQQGFTLLEVMIALMLICLVIVSVIQLSSSHLRNLGRSGDYIDALSAANDKMREVLDASLTEETSRRETDDDGYVFDIHVSEIEKTRTEGLAVKFMQVTVTASHATNRSGKAVTLKTAMLSSKDGLNDTSESAALGKLLP